jgi:hypothetical protein
MKCYTGEMRFYDCKISICIYQLDCLFDLGVLFDYRRAFLTRFHIREADGFYSEPEDQRRRLGAAGTGKQGHAGLV